MTTVTAAAAPAPAHVPSASQGSLPGGSLPQPSPPLWADVAASPGRWATVVPSRRAAVAAAAAGPQNWWAQPTAPRRRPATYHEFGPRLTRQQIVVEGGDEDGPRFREAEGEDEDDEDDEAYVAPPSTPGQEATPPSHHPTTGPSSEATPSASAMQRLLQPLLLRVSPQLALFIP